MTRTLVDPKQINVWANVNFSARCDIPHILLDDPYTTLVDPKQIKCWAIVNFSSRCDIPHMCTDLLRCSGAKGMMGGINSLLSVEYLHSIPLVSRTPTIIFGMDVSHGSPGRSDVPSIAACNSVGFGRRFGLATCASQMASVRAQSARVEMIDGLFKPVADRLRELLDDYYTSTTRQLKPQHIIIFRDGVSESQFNQVLNIELEQIMQGTTRPTHYHVLLDQIGFSPDDLQELVHSLSYVYQRSTTAISVVAPICYAHLAAQQMSQFVKYDDMSDAASSHK
ncbi:PAZ domain-containing protein [Tanacetum coccineum]